MKLCTKRKKRKDHSISSVSFHSLYIITYCLVSFLCFHHVPFTAAVASLSLASSLNIEILGGNINSSNDSEKIILIVHQIKYFQTSNTSKISIEPSDILFLVHSSHVKTNYDCFLFDPTLERTTNTNMDPSGYDTEINQENKFSLLVKDPQYAGTYIQICYKSSSSSSSNYEYYLIPQVFYIKHLFGMESKSIQGSNSNSHIAILNISKQFQTIGQSSPGDVAKWIDISNIPLPLLPLSSQLCHHDSLQIGPLSYVNAQNEIQFLFTHHNVSSSSSLETSTSTSSPSSCNAVHVLCYQFGEEPFQIYPHISLQIMHIESLNQTQTIINSGQPIQIYGSGMRANDTIQFVQPHQPCDCHDDCNDDDSNHHGGNDTDNATERMIVHQATVDMEDVFFIVPSFEKATTNMILCYQFQTEPFVRYDSIKLTSFEGKVQNQFYSVVAHQPTNITLKGTFGMTTQDELKWVPYESTSCSVPAMDFIQSFILDDEISVQDNTDHEDKNEDEEEGYPIKTQMIQIYTLMGISEKTPVRLCYKFGPQNNFVFFPHVKLSSPRISHIVINNTQKHSSIQTHTPIQIQFQGIGIQPGDGGKFIPSSVNNGGDDVSVTDEDCIDSMPVAGSKDFVVDPSGFATVEFLNEVEDFFLCWQFQKHSREQRQLREMVWYDSSSETVIYDISHPWKLYKYIPILSSSPNEATKNTGGNIVEGNGHITLILDIGLDELKQDLSSFQSAFLINLSLALDVSPNRLSIEDIQMSSYPIHVQLVISPATLANPLVSEILDRMVLLLEHLESDIYADANLHLSFSNSKDVQTRIYSDPLTFQATPSSASKNSIQLSIYSYQENGVFGFESDIYYTTQMRKSINIIVKRSHGSFGTVVLECWTEDLTAQSNQDFLLESNILTFLPEEIEQVVKITLLDDIHMEKLHYKDFLMGIRIHHEKTLEGMKGTSYSAKINEMDMTTIRIYNYGNGSYQVVSTVFKKHPYDLYQYYHGWKVVGNGDPTCMSSEDCLSNEWLDSNGFTVLDAIYAEQEVQTDCPEISQNIISTLSSNQVHYNLHLDGSGSVKSEITVKEIGEELTISFWIKKSSSIDDKALQTILALTREGDKNDFEFLVSMSDSVIYLLIRGIFIEANYRQDDPEGGDRHGLNLGISINDHLWHHIYMSWRSIDGRVIAYKDGSLVFGNVSPYQFGEKLGSGRIIVGQLDNHLSDTCTGFKGEIESIIVSDMFSRKGSDVLATMHVPLQLISDEMIIVWDFSQVENSRVLSKSWGDKYSGILSSVGSRIIEGTVPQLHSPKENVAHFCASIWYYKAPIGFTGNIITAYGGRLQFKLMSPSHSGHIRKRENFIILKAVNGDVITYPNLFREPRSNHWTYHSIILREDHGWRSYPEQRRITREQFKAILQNVEEILIRGDEWVYGKDGPGMEITILNDVSLISI